MIKWDPKFTKEELALIEDYGPVTYDAPEGAVAQMPERASPDSDDWHIVQSKAELVEAIWGKTAREQYERGLKDDSCNPTPEGD